MEDITQRDLSSRPVQDLTEAERQELHRRFDEFLGAMRKASGKPELEPEPKKTVKKWNPAMQARRASA
jgi:hypothetical protein